MRHIRRVWRGWQIILFIDRGSLHTAYARRVLAHQIGIEIRWLPVAHTGMQCAGRPAATYKAQGVANRPVMPIDASADERCQYLSDLSPQQRLQKAGIFFKTFWLN